jgi:Cu/Ag efflux pump CusA
VRISEISIERPVLASVMSLLILVAGLAAFVMLPVREYPDVDPPEVSVTTVYAGASPETVETAVTEPLGGTSIWLPPTSPTRSSAGFAIYPRKPSGRLCPRRARDRGRSCGST